MKLIKLDAIDSTNEFLKGLSSKQALENFTVVSAEIQTKGKGQMGAIWITEPSKNLIMSVLIKDFLGDAKQIFNVNIAFSLSVIQALETMNIPELSIKWPNDIMSYNKKIGGILIENSIKSDGTIYSIVGLGLNVNQTNFEDLPKASSLAEIVDTSFDNEAILFAIIENLEKNIQSWNQNSDAMWINYRDTLFKKGIPMPFSKEDGSNFMGIIEGVNSHGQLVVLLENDTVGEYGIKEIQMLY